jgi:hypothetical protein
MLVMGTTGARMDLPPLPPPPLLLLLRNGMLFPAIGCPAVATGLAGLTRFPTFLPPPPAVVGPPVPLPLPLLPPSPIPSSTRSCWLTPL